MSMSISCHHISRRRWWRRHSCQLLSKIGLKSASALFLKHGRASLLVLRYFLEILCDFSLGCFWVGSWASLSIKLLSLGCAFHEGCIIERLRGCSCICLCFLSRCDILCQRRLWIIGLQSWVKFLWCRNGALLIRLGDVLWILIFVWRLSLNDWLRWVGGTEVWSDHSWDSSR